MCERPCNYVLLRNAKQAPTILMGFYSHGMRRDCGPCCGSCCCAEDCGSSNDAPRLRRLWLMGMMPRLRMYPCAWPCLGRCSSCLGILALRHLQLMPSGFGLGHLGNCPDLELSSATRSSCSCPCATCKYLVHLTHLGHSGGHHQFGVGEILPHLVHMVYYNGLLGCSS